MILGSLSQIFGKFHDLTSGPNIISVVPEHTVSRFKLLKGNQSYRCSNCKDFITSFIWEERKKKTLPLPVHSTLKNMRILRTGDGCPI